MTEPLGLVKIVRNKGRIAGFAHLPVQPQVLVCGTNRPRKKYGKRAMGWSFPPAVRELLLRNCQGKQALHLFGGMADFGYRLDLDPATNPHKVGDAFLAHKYFPRDSFDDVILDPPYSICERCFTDLTLDAGRRISKAVPAQRKQEIRCLMDTAAWIARRHVWWFHTISIATHALLPLDAIWLVYCGDQCSVRVLQRFTVKQPKRVPPDVTTFERGPALKYARWIQEQPPILFDNVDYSVVLGSDPRVPEVQE